MAYVTFDTKGIRGRGHHPWKEDTLEKEIKRLVDEKLECEEHARMIIDEINKLKKRKPTKRNVQRIHNLIYGSTYKFGGLNELNQRHRNLVMRIDKLEWDICNIVKVIDEECKYENCNCKKMNLIRFPKDYVHYSKKECSKCGRLQKFMNNFEYHSYTEYNYE